MKPGPISPIFGFSKKRGSHLAKTASSAGPDLRYQSIAAEILAELKAKPADEILIKGEIPKHMRERGETDVLWTLSSVYGDVEHEVLSTFCLNTAVLVLAEISENTGIRMQASPGLRGWSEAYSIPDLAASFVAMTSDQMARLNKGFPNGSKMDLDSYRGPELRHALQEASSQHGRLRLIQKIA